MHIINEYKIIKILIVVYMQVNYKIIVKSNNGLTVSLRVYSTINHVTMPSYIGGGGANHTAS